MSTLQNKINADYIIAWKGGEATKVTKAALNSLKNEITKAELTDKGKVVLTDDDVLKVITKAIKQRQDSIAQFEKGGRADLVAAETAEMLVFQSYLPAQMTEAEIEAGIRAIIPTLGGVPSNVLPGKTTGAFKQKYNGQYDMATFKKILDRILI